MLRVGAVWYLIRSHAGAWEREHIANSLAVFISPSPLTGSTFLPLPLPRSHAPRGSGVVSHTFPRWSVGTRTHCQLPCSVHLSLSFDGLHFSPLSLPRSHAPRGSGSIEAGEIQSYSSVSSRKLNGCRIDVIGEPVNQRG